jgi:FkbM family methyltransferase
MKSMFESNYEWCIDFIKKDKVNIIAEIGSNDALDAIYLSKYFNANKCFIFEADPELSDTIKKNISNAENKDSLQFFNIALGNFSGSVVFKSVDKSLFNNHGVGSLFEINFQNREVSDEDYNRQSVQKNINVEMKTYSGLDIPIPDLIAMDVQGAELSVLEGFKNDIDKCSFIILESSISENYIGGSTLLDVYKYLRSKKFKLVANTRNESNLGILYEAIKYRILGKTHYIHDINFLFVNKRYL